MNPKNKNRYALADYPHLVRSPLGRIQFREGIYYRLWPLLSVLARYYRRLFVSRTRVVAVVGSFGKTTTARALTHALQRRVHGKMSRNCWSHVAGSVFRIRPGDNHSVIEVGINGPGQMGPYARVVRPDIAVVTSIGSEHHRSLGSLEVTRAEKAEMVRALPDTGLAVLNGDDPNVRWMTGLTGARVITCGLDESNDVRASEVRLAWPEGTRFKVHINGETAQVRTALFGPHMVYPVLAAIAVATAEGFSLAQVLSSVGSMPPTPGRLERLQLPGGAILLRDDFKSSLETIHAALDVFSAMPPGRKGIVLGEVSEPRGSQGPIYRELGSRLTGLVDYAVFVGGNFQRYAAGARKSGFPASAMHDAGTNVQKAAECLRNELRPGDVVLLKGRDTQRLERISLALEGRTVRCDIEFCDTRAVSCGDCPMLERGWEGLRVVI